MLVDCPRALLRRHPEIQEVMTGYRLLEDHNLLPSKGTWTEQPATFIEAIHVIKSEKADIEAAIAERAKRGQKANAGP